MRARAAASAVLAATLGCSFLPRRATPPEGALPPAYSTGVAQAVHENHWWQDFESVQLSALVDEAIRENLTLRQLWARLDQANSLVTQAGSGLYPQVDLLAGAEYNRTEIRPEDPRPSFRSRLREAVLEGLSSSVRDALQGGGTGGADARSLFSGLDFSSEPRPPRRVVTETRRYGLSIAASYEVDIWGRIAAQYRAAQFELTASREDLESAAMTLAAEVADRWLRILEQEELGRILVEQLDTNRTYLELVELRFRKGLVSALDVYQQRQAVSEVERQLPLVKAAAQVLRHDLAVLLGSPPSGGAIELDIGEYDLAVVPPPPETGIPADLLRLRPDVRAAMARLSAGDHRVASARADLLPAIRLTGGVGLSTERISAFFDDWFVNLAANLVQPLFDGFRRQAEVERALALTEELLAGYRLTVLSAMREVEDALVQEREQRQHLRALAEQLQAARNALREAGQRYQRGVSDYLPVLAALERTQALDRDLVIARRELLIFRVSLYRALGGTWTSTLAAPARLSDQVAEAEDLSL